MNNREGGTRENQEAVKAPEAAIDEVLAPMEANEAAESDSYSARREKLGDFLKSKGLFAIDTVRVAAMTALRFTWSLIRILGESVTGKMSFKRGMEITGEAFDYGKKKGGK